MMIKIKRNFKVYNINLNSSSPPKDLALLRNSVKSPYLNRLRYNVINKNKLSVVYEIYFAFVEFTMPGLIF